MGEEIVTQAGSRVHVYSECGYVKIISLIDGEFLGPSFDRTNARKLIAALTEAVGDGE